MCAWEPPPPSLTKVTSTNSPGAVDFLNVETRDLGFSQEGPKKVFLVGHCTALL